MTTVVATVCCSFTVQIAVFCNLYNVCKMLYNYSPSGSETLRSATAECSPQRKAKVSPYEMSSLEIRQNFYFEGECCCFFNHIALFPSFTTAQ